MRRPLSLLAFAAALTLAIVPASEAQGRRDRDRGLVEMDSPSIRGGFFLSGGIGAGREQYKFSDEDAFTEPLTKPTLTLRLGGTPDSYVRLGGELFGWGAETDEGEETFGAVLGVVQFYPLRDGGLWLKAGGGYAESAVDFFDPDFFDTSESGFAWSVGAGYEIQLSRSIAIGPSVEFYQGSFSRRDEPTLTERVLNIGGQITFQTGGRRR
jgi:opacity protein-like surface antigen